MMLRLMLALGLVTSIGPQPRLPSGPQAEMEAAITRLGSGRGTDYFNGELQLLMQRPDLAARLLIDELRVINPVPAFIVPPETADSAENRQALHVVWCIRALRYVTGGVDFRAPTAYQFGPEERFREQWLRKRAPDAALPFFATRMSTDTVFVAPIDAQEQIIQKWKTWYAETASKHQFRAAEILEDWYF